jgi:tyrosyl-tRNA synthetase
MLKLVPFQATTSSFATLRPPTVPSAPIALGTSLTDALVRTGLVRSRSEAGRLIAGGGAYVNNVRADADRALGAGDLATESVIVLRSGKKSFALLRVT